MKNNCATCTKIPSWSFSENVVAYCPAHQKYITKADGCDSIPKVTKKKATTKKVAKKDTKKD